MKIVDNIYDTAAKTALASANTELVTVAVLQSADGKPFALYAMMCGHLPPLDTVRDNELAGVVACCRAQKDGRRALEALD